MDIKFTDRAQINGFRQTQDGYLVGDVLCARSGCQTYMRSELGLMGDGTVIVYRPEAAVFAKDSLATYAGKPVTMGHPPEPVTADNWKTYAIGDIGAEIARDGDFVRVPLKLMDAAAIASVSAGTREISMGYTTPVEIVDGVAPDGTAYQAVQTGPIRINHLAVVDAARGGQKLRIGDGAISWGAGPVTVSDKGGLMGDLRKIMVDGLQVETTDAGAAAIEKLTKALADATASAAKMEAERDSAIAARDAAVLTDAALDARVAARADLIAKATMIAKDIKTAGLSDAAIRKAAVVAVLGDAAVAGKSDAYVDARFDILAEDAAKGDPIKDAKPVQVVADDLAKFYADRNAALANAWKGESK